MDRVADPSGLHWRSTVRWDQTEAPVRSTAVVIIDEDLERVLKVPCVQINSQSRHSDRTVRTKRSAIAFASGVCTGVRTTRTPCASNTAAKRLVNLQSRSRIKKRTGSSLSPSPHVTCRAC